jgi:spore photoproduct lyase
MFPEKIYYEPDALSYKLGAVLKERYREIPWIPIENHNNIKELRSLGNEAFARMKRFLVVGVRKSLAYTPNHKISDYLVPYTSSGCSAMCLYCYLVCNYNKCSYLRLFVNREEMLSKLMREAERAEGDKVFEIGSNSDLVLENTITGNLAWTVERFGKSKKGLITFPTKFDMVEPLLGLDHRGRTIPRMSVNPEEVISRMEFGTSPLQARIRAVNRLREAGYHARILIAPVALIENWKQAYTGLLEQLSDGLSEQAKKDMTIEIIYMTYSFVHRAINREAFPNALNLYDASLMTGRGRGRYCYRTDIRREGEAFLREEIEKRLPGVPILYVV